MDAERRRALQGIRQSQEIFESQGERLQKLFPHQFIAMIDGIVIEHNPDLDTLTECVYSKYEERPIFIKNVDAPQTRLVPTLFRRANSDSA